MPQQVDLVLQNAAAANKTFSAISPSAGDKSVAQWWLREGAVKGAFPKITSEAHATTNKSRKLNVKLQLPSSFVDSTTGLTIVGPAAEMNASVSMPDEFPESLKNDFAAYAKNLISAALVQSMIKDAVSAT